jgi:hypothetical protein
LAFEKNRTLGGGGGGGLNCVYLSKFKDRFVSASQ